MTMFGVGIAKWPCGHDIETAATIADCERQIAAARRCAELYERCNMGERFRARTFETFDHKRDPEAFGMCIKYARGFDKYRLSGRGVLLASPTKGNGKTHLACAIMHEVMQRHLTDCIFSRVPDVVDDSRHEDTDGKYQFARREYSTVGLLILDDLGKERITPFAAETLWKIIDARYQAARPLVITTNLTETTLLNAANDTASRDCWDSIISRLAEMCREVRCTASDYRLENAQ